MEKILTTILKEGGAASAASIRVSEVAEDALSRYMAWLADGKNAGMAYMANHLPIRKNPALLLDPPARTIICCAFPWQGDARAESLGIASYALGSDYHDVIRKSLQGAVAHLREEYGGEWRICIDSAPIMERYWAVKSGLGILMDNGMVNVPGIGENCFLAEVLTDLSLPEGKASRIPEATASECLHCGKCREACPTGALDSDGEHPGVIDSRLCINYLTIEHRGEWDSKQKETMSRPGAAGAFFGCDICRNACPVGNPLTDTSLILPELLPREEILQLTANDIFGDEETLKQLLRKSPLKRPKPEGLRRNASPRPPKTNPLG